jgi:CRISPR-associated protein Cas1
MELVLNSYGSTLTKENGLFVIETSDGKQSIPPDKLKSITISKAVRISSDAIILAIKNKIDVVFLNDFGHPEGRVWSVQYGSISSIRKSQLDFFYSNAVIPWVKKMLVDKINSQISILLAFQPEKEVLPQHNLVKGAINSLNDFIQKINTLEGESLSDMAPTLRGWEGVAGKKYFGTLSSLLPEEYQFENRNRQPATDIFNAMINYSYGILYGKVEGSLIKAGIDPYVGIFHRDDFNRPALVYDVIEKYRMWMDYVVLSLCMQKAIVADCYRIDAHTGACLLEPLGKRILVQAVNDYLYEIILFNAKERSRLTHLDLDMQQLAQFFLKTTSSQ